MRCSIFDGGNDLNIEIYKKTFSTAENPHSWAGLRGRTHMYSFHRV